MKGFCISAGLLDDLTFEQNNQPVGDCINESRVMRHDERRAASFIMQLLSRPLWRWRPAEASLRSIHADMIAGCGLVPGDPLAPIMNRSFQCPILLRGHPEYSSRCARAEQMSPQAPEKCTERQSDVHPEGHHLTGGGDRCLEGPRSRTIDTARVS
jgi:hypothetical protein